MPAPRIRGDHDALAKIAQGFAKESASTQRSLRKIKQSMDTLQGGDWIGKGANAFYKEMEGDVLPAVQRLESALGRANQVTRQISSILQEAEEEAARILGAILAGAAAVGAGGLAAAAAEALRDFAGGSPHVVLDPASLFSDGYMRGLIGSRFQGAGAALGAAMDDLFSDLTRPADEVEGILVVIADLRGRPLEDIKSEYGKFQELMQERDAAGAAGVGGLSDFHGSFMGSNTQMRYGSVIGDAFGVDPVFGAMLNPTGGLVGPGNWAIAGDDTAVGYHGVIHDAAGYLHTYHGVGPGYDYLGVDPIPTTNPLSGQVAGVAYWTATTQVVEPMRQVVRGAMDNFQRAADVGGWMFEQAAGVF